MALSEFGMVLRRHVRLLVVVPVACFIVCFLGMVLFAKPVYSATAKLLVSDDVPVARIVAESKAADAAGLFSRDGAQLTVQADSANSLVEIVAEGGNAVACEEAANLVVAEAADSLAADYPLLLVRSEEAQSAERTTASPLQCALVAALAVLLVALCAIAVEDARSRRIHSWRSVEEATGLPFLGKVRGDREDRDRIFLNVRLAGSSGGKSDETVCFMPAGETAAAEEAAAELMSVKAKRPMTATATQSLSANVRPVLKALGADIVVLAVEGEVSTFDDVEELLREASIAHLKPVGFVFAECAVQAAVVPPRMSRRPGRRHQDTGGFAAVAGASGDAGSAGASGASGEAEPAGDASAAARTADSAKAAS